MKSIKNGIVLSNVKCISNDIMNTQDAIKLMDEFLNLILQTKLSV